MPERAEPDPQAELQSLRYRLASLQTEVNSLRVHVTAWPAAILCALAILIPTYAERTDDDADPVAAPDSISLIELPGKASEADNGVIQIAAIALCLLLGAGLLATLYAAFARQGPASLIAIVAAAVALPAWFILLIAVGSSEGGGVIEELGFENSIQTLVVPVACVMTIVAGRTVDVTR